MKYPPKRYKIESDTRPNGRPFFMVFKGNRYLRTYDSLNEAEQYIERKDPNRCPAE